MVLRPELARTSQRATTSCAAMVAEVGSGGCEGPSYDVRTYCAICVRTCMRRARARVVLYCTIRAVAAEVRRIHRPLRRVG